MERDTVSYIAAVGIFAAIPGILIGIQSQLTPAFYPWVCSLPPFQRALIAPFVAYGWQFLFSNLELYIILAGALILMAGKAGISRAAVQLAVALVSVPVVTGVAKVLVDYQGTGLGFSGAVFALAGIVSFTLLRETRTMPLLKSLAVTLFVVGCVAIPLMIPPVRDLGDGGVFYTDVLSHWVGFVTGAVIANVLPLRDIRRVWPGYAVLAAVAWIALPAVL